MRLTQSHPSNRGDKDMNWNKWFERKDHRNKGWEMVNGTEEQRYQAFKARLLDEISIESCDSFTNEIAEGLYLEREKL